ncbi:MAG: hypothetical protein ACYCV4_05490 [Dermatophilaceae bacterium]
MRSEFVKGALVGVLAYWALQHFTGIGTSGLGARKSPGGLKPAGG